MLYLLFTIFILFPILGNADNVSIYEALNFNPQQEKTFYIKLKIQFISQIWHLRKKLLNKLIHALNGNIKFNEDYRSYTKIDLTYFPFDKKDKEVNIKLLILLAMVNGEGPVLAHATSSWKYASKNNRDKADVLKIFLSSYNLYHPKIHKIDDSKNDIIKRMNMEYHQYRYLWDEALSMNYKKSFSQFKVNEHEKTIDGRSYPDFVNNLNYKCAICLENLLTKKEIYKAFWEDVELPYLTIIWKFNHSIKSFRYLMAEAIYGHLIHIALKDVKHFLKCLYYNLLCVNKLAPPNSKDKLSSNVDEVKSKLMLRYSKRNNLDNFEKRMELRLERMIDTDVYYCSSDTYKTPNNLKFSKKKVLEDDFFISNLTTFKGEVQYITNPKFSMADFGTSPKPKIAVGLVKGFCEIAAPHVIYQPQLITSPIVHCEYLVTNTSNIPAMKRLFSRANPRQYMVDVYDAVNHPDTIWLYEDAVNRAEFLKEFKENRAPDDLPDLDPGDDMGLLGHREDLTDAKMVVTVNPNVAIKAVRYPENLTPLKIVHLVRKDTLFNYEIKANLKSILGELQESRLRYIKDKEKEEDNQKKTSMKHRKKQKILAKAMHDEIRSVLHRPSSRKHLEKWGWKNAPIIDPNAMNRDDYVQLGFLVILPIVLFSFFFLVVYKNF